MIVNLLEATLLIINNAGHNEGDVRYVTFYNDDTDEMQYCTWGEFSDISEEINYDENDTLDSSRRIIKAEISIVADTWWLRRTRDTDDCETWLYQELPISLEDLVEGDGELDVKYIISELDVMTDEYKALVEEVVKEYPFAKPSEITIKDTAYDVIDDDGIDKVMKNGNVAVITATEGRYWTCSSYHSKDIRMLFHPELIKLVMEETYEDGDVFNNEYIEEHLGLSTHGFDNDSFKTLSIHWIPRGIAFNIINVTSDDGTIVRETLDFPKQVNWLVS